MNKLNRLIILFFFVYINSVYAQVLVYSHRGGRALWPENTLYAYQKSLELKVDFVDMDIQMSKDGEFVVTHDAYLNPELTRDLNGHWLLEKLKISELTVKQLKQYDVGEINHNSQYGQDYPAQIVGLHQKIPTLRETIRYVRSHQQNPTGFQIEIKTPKQKLNDKVWANHYAKALYRLLKQEAIFSQSEIQSFDFAVLDALYKIDNQIKLAYLTDNNHSLDVWGGGHTLTKGHHIFELVHDLHGTLWEPSADSVNSEDIKQAHDIGLKVVVWGLPKSPELEKKQIKELIEAGVDGIITDRPDLMLEML